MLLILEEVVPREEDGSQCLLQLPVVAVSALELVVVAVVAAVLVLEQPFAAVVEAFVVARQFVVRVRGLPSEVVVH